MDSFGDVLLICVVITVFLVLVLSSLNKGKNKSTVNTKPQQVAKSPIKDVTQQNEFVETKSETPKTEDDLVSFAQTQLIGGNRFVESYKKDLHNLHMNPRFMEEMFALRKIFNGREITDTKNVNKEIADYFYKNNLNEKYAQVNSITQKVRNYGKQASAHISIYYAMFLFDWKHD